MKNAVLLGSLSLQSYQYGENKRSLGLVSLRNCIKLLVLEIEGNTMVSQIREAGDQNLT